MKSTAPVSVVIPCYRCKSTISRAIESILLQTVIPSEIILIDDYSDDGSLKLLKQMQDQYSDLIKVIALEENLGVSNARNIGWKLAREPYIAFLDSDDAWHSKKIEIQYAYMKDHPEIALCGHGSQVLLPQDGLPKWEVRSIFEVDSINRRSLLVSNPFVTPSVMLCKDISERFAENRRYMEDHLLWLDVAFSGARVVKLDIPLVATYKKAFGEAGLSSQLCEMQMGEIDNYKNLLKKKYINYFQWILLSAYSWCKFIRRLIISKAYSILRSTS